MTVATSGNVLELSPGLRLHKGYLDLAAQALVLEAVRTVLRDAPLFTPRMPNTGAPMSVRMSNCGSLGWVADEQGYRYIAAHPVTRRPWPQMPECISRLWGELSAYDYLPEACLINYYGQTARMGLHQDRDEETLVAPVVSISLGDTCVFRYGGARRRDPTRSIKLASGDALVMSGDARLAFHGVDRLLFGSSRLLPEGGRFNLTLRRVTGEPQNRLAQPFGPPLDTPTFAARSMRSPIV